MNHESIAVLMTCFNRRQTTLRCLESLYSQQLPPNVSFVVFLVDDGCTDQTGAAVREKFPDVTVINGSGNLFWGGGMRLAWDTARAHVDYDYYLWLNDDVELNKTAVLTLINDYQTLFDETGMEALVSGCVYCPETGKTTYSGKNGEKRLEPTGAPQPVRHNNGNVVLISRGICCVLGNISKEFTHQMGDSDYGLRCLRAGFGCYVSSRYVGSCGANEKPVWFDPGIPLKKRLALLHAPTGMKPGERFVFIRRHYSLLKAISAVIKLYASALFPRLYFRLKSMTKSKGGLSLD
jgi:GT2 family glycosyltransferase